MNQYEVVQQPYDGVDQETYASAQVMSTADLAKAVSYYTYQGAQATVERNEALAAEYYHHAGIYNGILQVRADFVPVARHEQRSRNGIVARLGRLADTFSDKLAA